MGGNDIMNIYDDFFKGISYEYWEFFAADFLGAKGYILLKKRDISLAVSILSIVTNL